MRNLPRAIRFSIPALLALAGLIAGVAMTVEAKPEVLREDKPDDPGPVIVPPVSNDPQEKKEEEKEKEKPKKGSDRIDIPDDLFGPDKPEPPARRPSDRRPADPKPADPGPVAPDVMAPDPAPQAIDPVALEKAVGEAITKGVAWLKKRQDVDGSFGVSGQGPTYGGGGNAYNNKPGIAALSLLALLKSEVPPNDPVITKGFKYLYGHVGQKGNKISCYEMGVTLMAVETLYEATYKHLLKKSGRKVTARPGEFKEPKYSPSPSDAKFCLDLLKRLYRNQTKEGGWRYGEGFAIVGSPEDISATQIVMLGIKSAHRMRVPVDLNVVKRAMDFVMKSQETEGPTVPRPANITKDDRSTYASTGEDRARGWAYEKESENAHELAVTGSMTTAGIATLLISKSIIGRRIPKKESAAVDQAIWDGFAWLTTHWSVMRNPGTSRSHFYYLYGIERVGTLGMYKQIGKHPWYAEGAQVLVRLQKDSGCWDSKREVSPSDLFDTCFALLFLRRGTVPIGDVLRPRVYSGKSGPGGSKTKAR
jgi:hypothetical protein